MLSLKLMRGRCPTGGPVFNPRCRRLVALAAALIACAAAQPPTPEPLWPDGAPGAIGKDDVDRPELSFYGAKSPNGTAIIICPGGGYSHLSMDKEGAQVAQWLNTLNISAFVLKYRLGPRYHHPAMIDDAQRAIRIVRTRAASLGIRPDRIGIMGFSAGGHLASTAGTHFDSGHATSADPMERAGSRPDFLILGYPVISMNSEYTHAGSRTALLGDHPDPKLLDELSNDQRVTSQTPTTFIFQTNADTTVPAENSVRFYLALRKAGVPAELHIYEHGPHGVGLAQSDAILSSWPARLADWLRGRGLL
jgi:acetyl esterase/lipase